MRNYKVNIVTQFLGYQQLPLQTGFPRCYPLSVFNQ